ncbi:Tetratricopeptide repeat-like superfamily protein, putative isoform 1 [Hibiscus syriacus]|uniref:Tetratricopeptide repeat-like superfamily protein, putative isoform 1 n=1 Tax=Hibiscus syriacus TaxID=106335 RepID=A0A6A2ZJP8_HIBSY|nr:Tetratricopeptide repeat-like superfamily protein, putative isoform 1 [Hibiscus syriacus]
MEYRSMRILLHIGSYFAGQYYQVLGQQPDLVHQFYSDASRMIRVDGDSSESASSMLFINIQLQLYKRQARFKLNVSSPVAEPPVSDYVLEEEIMGESPAEETFVLHHSVVDTIQEPQLYFGGPVEEPPRRTYAYVIGTIHQSVLVSSHILLGQMCLNLQQRHSVGSLVSEEGVKNFGKIKPDGVFVRSRKDVVGSAMLLLSLKTSVLFTMQSRNGKRQGSYPAESSRGRIGSRSFGWEMSKRMGRGRGSYPAESSRGRIGSRSFGWEMSKSQVTYRSRSNGLYSKVIDRKRTDQLAPSEPETFSLPVPLPNGSSFTYFANGVASLLGQGFASGKVNLGELEVVKITRFSSFARSNAQEERKSVTFYKPVGIPDGFYSLGHYCQSIDQPFRGFVLAAREIPPESEPVRFSTHVASPALREPLDYALVWSSNNGSEDKLKGVASSGCLSLLRFSRVSVSDSALIKHYGATVFFHPDEIYMPSSVSWFFENGALLFRKAAEYLGEGVVSEPGWLQFMRKWGPTIVYDSRTELDKINILPLNFGIPANIFGKLPVELWRGRSYRPKVKNNWTGDERG